MFVLLFCNFYLSFYLFISHFKCVFMLEILTWHCCCYYCHFYLLTF